MSSNQKETNSSTDQKGVPQEITAPSPSQKKNNNNNSNQTIDDDSAHQSQIISDNYPTEAVTYLGFAEEIESPLDYFDDFPAELNGKIGGKPVWLNPLKIPDAHSCGVCGKVLPLLLQIYAPLNTKEFSLETFHRTIYVFCCKNSACHKKLEDQNKAFYILRCQLPESNDIYEYHQEEGEEEEEGERIAIRHQVLETRQKFCQVCGFFAAKKCTACNVANYCCQEHQVFDWRTLNGHKQLCPTLKQDPSHPSLRSTASLYGFSELILVTQEEDIPKEPTDIPNFEKALTITSTIEKDDVDEKEFEQGPLLDKEMFKFQETTRHFPDQCLRYYGISAKAASPLWVNKNQIPKVAQIPACQKCGGARKAEFQILPQLLFLMKIDVKQDMIDWGILTIYTCEKSCALDGKAQGEFLWIQQHAE